MEVLDRCSNDVFAVLHNHHAAAQAVAPSSQLASTARPMPKPSTAEWKPDKLTHDATLANYRTWMKIFRSYFDAGHLNTLPCTQQQAS